MTYAEGNVTEYEYDSYGNRTLERRKDVTQADGSKKDIISYWHYDSEGRILFYTDPERIDPNDVANPDNATTRYEYDVNGNQIKVTDALGNVSESVYDNKGQLVASLYQGEVEYVTLYDKGGRERAYITLAGSGRVSLLGVHDFKQLQVIDLPEGATPGAITIAPHDQFAYIADSKKGKIYVLDINPTSGRYNQVLETLTVEEAPEGIDSIALLYLIHRVYPRR